MAKPILETPADIATGVRALRRQCQALAHVHDVIGDPPVRRYAPGFAGLARIIVAQQVSAVSASAIWSRASATVTPFSPEVILTAPDELLRGAGLSLGKLKTIRAAASAVASGKLRLDTPASPAEIEAVGAALVAIKGIGPWTADIYTMFCIGHRDAFAPGDLALQLASKAAFGLPAKPNAIELTQIAERWRPWRGVAARLLWAYHAHQIK